MRIGGGCNCEVRGDKKTEGPKRNESESRLQIRHRPDALIHKVFNFFLVPLRVLGHGIKDVTEAAARREGGSVHLRDSVGEEGSLRYSVVLQKGLDKSIKYRTDCVLRAEVG